MNLRHFIRITATLGVAALIAGCGESAPPGAASAPPSVPVAEVVVRPVTPYAEFTGSLTAVEQVELRPRVAGYIQDVTVPEGRLVEKGQQLFLIDPRVFKAAQDAARARLREAEAAALLARTEHERAELLYARKVVARERLDSAIASRNASKAQVDAARAALDAAQLDLGFTRVTAPIGGRVGHIQVTEGNYVTNGVTALTSIVSVDPLYVYFDVDERTYLQALAPTRGREGEQAPRVKVALLTDESYGRSSRLDFLANAADRGTGTVRVRAVVDNPDGQLTPGLFAKVRLETGKPREQVLVADHSIGTDQGRRYVLVVDEGNKTQYRPVETRADGRRPAGRPPGPAAGRAHRRQGPGAAGHADHAAPCGNRWHARRPVEDRGGRTMTFPRFFIDRPIFAIVLSVLMMIGGIVSFFQLPLSEYPAVTPPTVQVTTAYPGANPDVIAQTVATPLEQAITGVEGMLYMSSQSATDGRMILTITFDQHIDPDMAQIQVQNRVSRVLSRLPDEVQRQGVVTQKTSPDILMVVHLLSPEQRYDPLYISNYAYLQVRDELLRLPGISDVVVWGAGEYSMRLWLDPDLIAARGLTAGEVIAAVREQNVQVAAGAVGQAPDSTAAFQVTVNTLGRLSDEEQFGDIIVRTGADGQVTRLRDVARIEMGGDAYALRSLLDGEPAVALQIVQSPGANALDTAEAVRATVARLEGNFPAGLSARIAYDPTVFVRASLQTVATTLLEAILLVVVVVVLFLRSWRASLIPLMAVPVSLVGTFAIMHLMGFSLNTLSLFGLVLSIGIVVDDAIVVVENVERHIENGEPPLQAARRAMDEVTGPIMAITSVLAAVFIPTAFLSGLQGEFYRQFALTIAISPSCRRSTR